MNSKQAFQRLAAAAQTGFIRTGDVHDELASTNDRALELCSLPHLDTPAIVIARRQLRGRGQGQHTWWSGDGSLTTSVVLDIDEQRLAAAQLPRVGITTAVAICDAVRHPLAGTVDDKSIGIKWPNDVLIEDRKVAGILVENAHNKRPCPARLVVGIGININNSFAAAPSDIRQRGTSLCDCVGEIVDSASLLQELIRFLEQRIQQLSADDPQLHQDWARRCALRGRWVRISMGNNTVEGCCLGMAEDGALLVDTTSSDQGATRIYSGHVAFVGDSPPCRPFDS